MTTAPHPRPGEYFSYPGAPPGIGIRIFHERDTEDVLNLLLTAFGRWPGIPIAVPPLDHLRWKLRLDHEGSHHRVAEVDGNMVGFIAAWSRPALINGQPLIIDDGGDICVHPDYQGRGVMGALIASGAPGRRNAACYLQGSTHPAVLRNRSNMTDPSGMFGNRIERFIRPLTFRAALATFRLRDGRSPRKLAARAARFSGWLAARGARRPAAAGLTVREGDAFDERTDGFWEEASRAFDFVMVRDRAYLSWRYADPRAGVFTILIAEDGERLAGWTVLSLERNGRRGALADLLVLPGRADAARALLREAVNRLRARGVESVECWLAERHPCRAALEDTGFVMRRRKEVSAYRATGGVPEASLAFLQEKSARVHLTLGDIDRV